ncbi:gustatory and odorant receptor 21a-like [Zeugodacus cucurbitae]|uniref:gustatory and odorant receptor 21a-like n=1 Tax=Zeugodacus cucurbitae TaxID=28588 RepID=UPI0023D962A9|nr:gustatory and odorant receptor 21a-like [Zeugodacus cucurbitae]
MAYWAIATRKGSPPMKITPVLNPNQREFLEDELLYREKLEILAENNTISTDLFVRKFEDIDDPVLLDKHDSFYHTTKSLLVLFQIMGVMPIHRNPQKPGMPRTGYSWTSKQVFWAICVFSMQTTIVVLVLRERVNTFLNDSDRRFDEAIYNVIFISLLFTNFLLPVASWRHGPQVAIFKNMWTNYQLKFLKVTGSPIVFPNLYPLTWSLCFFSWGVSIAINLSQYYLQPDFKLWYTFAYYPIIAMLNGFCSLWYINCTAFGTASRALSASLELTMMGDKPAKKLTEYRHLWVDLSHMMQQLGRAYSNMYGMYCLVVFFTTIIATYGSLSEIMDHGATYKEVGLFVIVFYCMSLLYIICNEAHYATQSVGLDFQTKLLNVDLTAVDSATQKEVEMFLMAITKNPPIMNLDGYANINRELITSNISFMATYLVVLLQFKITEQRNYSMKQSRMEVLMEE